MPEGDRQRKWGTRGYCTEPGCLSYAASADGWCGRHRNRIDDRRRQRAREVAQRTLGGPVLLNFPRPQKLAVPKRRKKAATRAKPTRYEHGPEKCLPECYCQVERKLQQLRRASTAEYLHRRPWFPRSDLSPAEFAQMFNWLYAHAEVLTDARYMRKAWFPEEELPRRAFGQMRDWLQNFSDVLTETDTQKGRRE